MSKQRVLTWDDDVIKCKDNIGGDLYFFDEGRPCIGRIQKIEDNGDSVQFKLAYCAEWVVLEGEWKWFSPEVMTVQKTLELRGGGTSCVAFGKSSIMPKTGAIMQSRIIQGLPKATERLLALYPDITFDMEKVRGVIVERAFKWQMTDRGELSMASNIRDVIAKFRKDAFAEEFLRFYIAELNDSADVFKAVY